MKRSVISLLICIAANFTLQAGQTTNLAVCIAKITNVASCSLQEKYKCKNAEETAQCYDVMPNSTVNNKDCPRIHQLILHQVVTILEVLEHEYKVLIHHAWVQNKEGKYVPLTGYVLKEDVQLVSTLRAEIDPKKYIPDQPGFSNSAPYVVLKEPFYNHSIGTRFNLSCEDNNNSSALRNNKWNVRALSYTSHGATDLCYSIPKEFCHVALDGKLSISSEECVEEAIKNTSEKCPFTWGGATYTHPLHDDVKPIKSTMNDENNNPYERWDRTDMPLLRSGMDASGYFLTLCQLCHIQNFAKNTTTLFALLDTIKPGYSLKNLDVVIFAGYAGFLHPEHNRITETRGYTNHSGRVRTVELSKTFKGIETTEQLLEAYYAGTPLELLSDAGAVIMAVKSWKIAPFESLNLIGQKIRGS